MCLLRPWLVWYIFPQVSHVNCFASPSPLSIDFLTTLSLTYFTRGCRSSLCRRRLLIDWYLTPQGSQTYGFSIKTSLHSSSLDTSTSASPTDVLMTLSIFEWCRSSIWRRRLFFVWYLNPQVPQTNGFIAEGSTWHEPSLNIIKCLLRASFVLKLLWHLTQAK